METQLNLKIKSVQSDWDGKYRTLNTYLKTQGIIHRIACSHTHEYNGVAESKIFHVVDTSLTLLAHVNIPLKYWHFAFDSSILIINSLPTKFLKDTSHYFYLVRTHQKYHQFKIFRCVVFPLLRTYNKNKFPFT